MIANLTEYLTEYLKLLIIAEQTDPQFLKEVGDLKLTSDRNKSDACGWLHLST
ncbi:MAG: hypothetical protein RMX35_29845 [Nostoc sp. DcaGUA01]|nr:hypothetical protein [Nostoc sp. DcaGUA01]